jgi:hypothetical protein
MPEINWMAVATIILAIATAFNGWALYASSHVKSPSRKPKRKAANINIVLRWMVILNRWAIRYRYLLVFGSVIQVIVLAVSHWRRSTVNGRSTAILGIALFLLSSQMLMLVIYHFTVRVNQLQEKIDQRSKLGTRSRV